jgi:hypothetical protein
MSLLVGLRVSSRSPPMDRTIRPVPRLVPAYKLFETWEEAIAFGVVPPGSAGRAVMQFGVAVRVGLGIGGC